MDAAAEPSRRRGEAVLLAVLAGVTFLAFVPVLRNGFVQWDDQRAILENPSFRGLGPEPLRWMFTTFHMGHYQPLAWLSLSVDHALWGLNPAGYHLTALLIHVAATLLLFVFLRRLLRAPPGVLSPETAGAAAGALLWGLHPLRVESVAWATERRDVLCVFFLLLSLIAYLRYAEARREGRPWGRALALSLAAFSASLLSKSMGIMLPAALLVLDLFPLRRWGPGRRAALLLEKAPYAALSAAVAVVTLLAMRELGEVRDVRSYAVLDRVLQAAFGLAFYPVKTALPLNLCPLYPIEGLDLRGPVFWGALGAVVAAGVSLLALRRRLPWAGAAALAYATLVFPVLGLFVEGHQLVADRYAYLSALPFSALAAAAVARTGVRPVVLAVSGAVLLGLGAATSLQCAVWRDTFSLWDRAITTGWPGSMAFKGRGGARLAQGDAAGALADLSEAIRRKPSFMDAYLFRAEARAALGDVPGALGDFAEAIRLRPGYPETYLRRGVVKSAAGDAEGAIADFGRTLELFPDFARAHFYRAQLRHRRGERPAALEDIRRVILLDSDHGPAYALRGRLREESGDAAGALSDYDRAIRLAPEAGTHNLRGALRASRGDAQAAFADFDRAIRLDPRLAEAWHNRGLLRAGMGDPLRAETDFSEVIRLTPTASDAWSRRAAARAAQGRMEEAVSDFREAVRLSPEDPSGHLNLGLARQASGDRKGALADFGEALRLAPLDWPHRATVQARIAELK